MARSLSAWLRCFLALYPGRRNSIFLFLASILFLCFLSFFLAAMSGLATACKTEGRHKCITRDEMVALLCVCVRFGCPSYLHGSVSFACSSPLWELLLDSREGQRESLQPHLFLQQLDQLLCQVLQCGIWTRKESSVESLCRNSQGLCHRFLVFFFTDRFRAVTLVCVGAVQLPVQRSDDGGQIWAESLLPQVHGYRSQELKHTRSLKERAEGKTDFYNHLFSA